MTLLNVMPTAERRIEVDYGSMWTATSPTGRGQRHTLACLDTLHDHQVVASVLDGRRLAAVLTDPPYSSGGLHASHRRKSPVSKYQHDVSNAKRRFTDWSGDNRDQRSWTRWCSAWLSDLWRLSQPETYLFTFIDWRQLPALSDAVQIAGWTWRGVSVWDKGDGVRAPHHGYFRSQLEYVVWGTAGHLPARFDRDRIIPGIFRRAPDRKRHHLVSIGFELSPVILSQALERLTSLGFRVEPSDRNLFEKPFLKNCEAPHCRPTGTRATPSRREMHNFFPAMDQSHEPGSED